MKNLTDLPLEILQEISSLLSLRDSIALSSTCISLSRINEIKYYFEYDEKEVEHRTRRALSMESVESLINEDYQNQANHDRLFRSNIKGTCDKRTPRRTENSIEG
jgi:hypothetical protein